MNPVGRALTAESHLRGRASFVAARPVSPVIRFIRKVADAPTVETQSDGQLLNCFMARRDEAAFAELVRRHGPLVLGVCRRVLQDEHDAEDAFQATFLVLVRKAASIHKTEALGWPRGTVGNRIARGRALLRSRLARRGLTLSAAVVATSLARAEEAVVPPTLLNATVQTAAQMSSGRATAAISPHILALAKGA